MRRSRENCMLQGWANAFWGDCGMNVDVEVFDNLDRAGLTVRVLDLETDILWRFDLSRYVCVRDSRSAEAHVIAYFEEQELRIRQATFYVHHCREVLRAVQQERHDRFMRALLEMQPGAQA